MRASVRVEKTCSDTRNESESNFVGTGRVLVKQSTLLHLQPTTIFGERFE